MILIGNSHYKKLHGNCSYGKRLVIHGERNWLTAFSAPSHPFFGKLQHHLQGSDIDICAVEANTKQAQKEFSHPEAFHLLVNQPPSYGPQQLHVYPASIVGFWHMDETGSGAHSSRRMIEFSPELINGNKASYFFNGVSGFMIRENMSTYTQPNRVDQGLEMAFATIFCQPITDPSTKPFLSHLEIIDAVGKFNSNARIYVHSHPDLSKKERKAIFEKCYPHDNIVFSDASIHDLISASEVVVTQNSDHCFEAIMHKRPIITCAKSPYWHASLTAKTRTDLNHALANAVQAMDDFAWEKYFYWSLARHGLEPAKDNFGSRAMARIFDKAGW